MLSLKLNACSDKFKEFYGRNTEQMPKMIAEGLVPLGAIELIQRRLDLLDDSQEYIHYSKEVTSAWIDNNFDTGDAIIYHPDGRFKVVLDAEHITRNLNPKSTLKDRALVLPSELYNTLEGEEFTRKEVERHGFVEKMLTPEEAKHNPIWKALTGGNQTLLENYVDAVFTKEESRFDKAMQIWLSKPQEVTTGRLLCIGSIGFGSNAIGNYNLIDTFGRLVGVKP